MAIDFTVKDIKHKIVTKFIHAFLPEARKPYNLKEQITDNSVIVRKHSVL